MSLIRLNDIQKSYSAGATQSVVLKDLEFTIDAGDFIAIKGPSGSGKTTLCNLVSLIDTPDSGTVVFNDQNTAELSDTEKASFRAEHIGIIFQNFNLLPVLSALENVKLPKEIAGYSNSEATESAERLLNAVGLEDHMHRRPALLSGGQQQRVAIARAMVMEPELIVADEPTANLDTTSATQIISLMQDLNNEHQVAFLFATHDDRLMQYVSREIEMKDGVLHEITGDS